MIRQPNRNVYKTVVVVWLALSIGSVLLAAITWVQLSHNLRSAGEAVGVQHELDSILSAMLDVETAQRGFTITGDRAFLEPLVLAESNLPPAFERLSGFVKEDNAVLKSLMDLRAQAEVCLNFAHRVISARESQGTQAAANMVATGEGKHLMDELRAKVNELRDLRSGYVSDFGSTTRTQLLRASLTSLIAGILGVGAGAFAFWLARVMLGHEERERELVEAKLQAERSSAEKTVFLANMSHEIRTPMNAILGFSELLESELQEPKHRQYLRSIRSSAGSLLQLINDILDMSKIEAGVMELRPEPTDPREICEFLHTVFAEATVRKKIKLECKVTEDLPRALLLDRIRMRQILVNLLGNAVKFTDRGEITVRVHWEKEESSSHITLLIEVKDTGVGIPQDKLESIFKPFVQAGAHREREKQGTGLGLAIVRRLTEAMGGTVTAVSVVGQGASFRLRFPGIPISVRLAANEKTSQEAEADFNELEPALILVVDDNEENCQLVAGMFAGSHHKIVFGSDGLEAVSKARAIRPDLILLDLRMPGLDGREALVQIRKSPGLEVTPIIAVTASTLLKDEADMRQAFNGHLRKPFSKRELFVEVAQFLPRRAKLDPSLSEAEVAKPVQRKTEVSVPAELVSELRRLQSSEWPAIRDTLAINQTKVFAWKVDSLTKRWPCPPLAGYAQALAHYAEIYEVVELEKQLRRFPTIVEQLACSPTK